MAISLRPFEHTDMDAVVALSLRAWAPVFVSIEEVLGDELFEFFYKGDWRRSQEADVRAACAEHTTLVADDDERVVGFTVVSIPEEGNEGEIYMLAVDPDAQQGGLGSRLTEAGVELIRRAGKAVAVVGTGSDPGHAPARATYEKAGFTAWPSHRYYRLLD
jgi:ribosomal protein S18 acetylase RimI-like enzyme